MFLLLHIWRTEAVSPSKVPKTMQATSVEDASPPAPRTAWQAKHKLKQCQLHAMFFVNCWLLHGCIRITTAFMAQKPAEPKDLPRQWSSNVRSSTVTDIQIVLVEDIWQTLGLQTALQLTP